MSVKVFVGNLPWSVGDLELEQLFAPYGDVRSARVVMDRETGRSRGFGFVEIEADNTSAVISALNGREVDGRALRVNEAESQERGGFGGGNRSAQGSGDRGPRSRY